MFLSLVVALVISIIIIIVAPKHHYSAHGIYLATHDYKVTPYQGQVSVLENMPAAAKVMGKIHVERFVKGNNQQNLQEIVQYSKRLAAMNGANAIVINQVAQTNATGVEQGLSSYILYATAIHHKDN